MKKSLIFMIFGAMLFYGCGDDGIGAKPKAPSCGDNDVKETVKEILLSQYKPVAIIGNYLGVPREVLFDALGSKHGDGKSSEEDVKRARDMLEKATLTEIDTIEQQDRESYCEAKFLKVPVSYSARYTDDGKTLKVKITKFE